MSKASVSSPTVVRRQGRAEGNGGIALARYLHRHAPANGDGPPSFRKVPLTSGVKLGAGLSALVAAGVSTFQGVKAVRAGTLSKGEALADITQDTGVAAGAGALGMVAGNLVAGATGGLPGMLLALGVTAGASMLSSRALHSVVDTFTGGD